MAVFLVFKFKYNRELRNAFEGFFPNFERKCDRILRHSQGLCRRIIAHLQPKFGEKTRKVILKRAFRNSRYE
ncbi:MAG: hypothetical protein A3D44_00440 [Candidatus Staskawiczbacteria bacterium RIFCSPHIGHO2_02_FULL_42_22]|uniref:Uncharacterized protein n=1 Tax=Candidatus Staskawiczbacteria bacterium RIFCSPHIGHO2_02_FULL_42_22 TaxID=1802207 RepID=A0A1G2I4M9_9BACT|nr:MAG: hypothetical protein A3D44_00440 [Candidatus Staskawiczbacteria bacterium RIFCSPHIGHO2_02_FULL_42_22]